MTKLFLHQETCLRSEIELDVLPVDVQTVGIFSREWGKLTTGLLFGKTELLLQAFEEAKPKTMAVLKNAIKIELPTTPTHVRFTANEEAVIVAIPPQGILVLDSSKLEQKVWTFETRG